MRSEPVVSGGPGSGSGLGEIRGVTDVVVEVHVRGGVAQDRIVVLNQHCWMNCITCKAAVVKASRERIIVQAE
jgi:hypothetical protein